MGNECVINFWTCNFAQKQISRLQKDSRDLNLQNQIFSFSYSENVILNDLSFQSIEDFILLVGTSVAFIAFILWCCFPIEPKDSLGGSEHLTTQVIKGVLSEYWLKSVHFFSTNETLRYVCIKVNMSLSFIGLKNP